MRRGRQAARQAQGPGPDAAGGKSTQGNGADVAADQRQAHREAAVDVGPHRQDQGRHEQQPRPGQGPVQGGVQEHEQQQREGLRPNDEHLPQAEKDEQAHPRRGEQRTRTPPAQGHEDPHHDGEYGGVDGLNQGQAAEPIEPVIGRLPAPVAILEMPAGDGAGEAILVEQPALLEQHPAAGEVVPQVRLVIAVHRRGDEHQGGHEKEVQPAVGGEHRSLCHTLAGDDRFSCSLSPVLRGEGSGVRGSASAEIHAPSPPTPLPRSGGEGRKNGHHQRLVMETLTRSGNPYNYRLRSTPWTCPCPP